MLTPGVGNATLKPSAPLSLLVALPVSAPDVTCALCAPPAWRLTATGSKLPPIKRAAIVPPYDITRLLKASGFQEATPTVSVTEPDASASRPPIALPWPASVLGLP